MGARERCERGERVRRRVGRAARGELVDEDVGDAIGDAVYFAVGDVRPLMLGLMLLERHVRPRMGAA